MAADDKFSERESQDKELLRQLEIQTLEKTIQDTPLEEREKYKLIVGNRSFTLEQILAEAKEGTEYGDMFLKMQSRSRMERMRRK